MNLLEIKYNHFRSPFQAEYQFQNSNVGGKQLEFVSSMPFSKNGAFRLRMYEAYFCNVTNHLITTMHVGQVSSTTPKCHELYSVDLLKHLILHLLINISTVLGQKQNKTQVWAEMAVSEKPAPETVSCEQTRSLTSLVSNDSNTPSWVKCY